MFAWCALLNYLWLLLCAENLIYLNNTIPWSLPPSSILLCLHFTGQAQLEALQTPWAPGIEWIKKTLGGKKYLSLGIHSNTCVYTHLSSTQTYINNVQATDELPTNIELGKGGPIGKRLETLPHLKARRRPTIKASASRLSHIPWCTKYIYIYIYSVSFSQALTHTHLLITQNVVVAKGCTRVLKHSNNFRAETAARSVGRAFHKQHNGLLVDQWCQSGVPREDMLYWVSAWVPIATSTFSIVKFTHM